MRFVRFIPLCFLISCAAKSSHTTTSNAPASYSSGESYHSGSTYHTDPDYKYEYRTGTSGDYTYNYDINGTDEDGDDVSGNVEMNGKYGSGTITDANGDDRDVDVEWNGYGSLKATDDDGNEYDLEVDD